VNNNQAHEYVLSGWNDLKPLLDSARDSSDDPWMKQYFPASAEMDDYFYGSVDRFALLLQVLARHCPTHARVLDAGAGYAMQTAALKAAGFQVSAADVYQDFPVYDTLNIPYQRWHLEAENQSPFADDYFDAVILSQTIEHFTYSPKDPLTRLLKIIRPGGYLLIDAPNISSFNNVSRLLRGKSIHWGLRKHYLEQEPQAIAGIPYYDRHNHEYAMQDLRDIADHFSLQMIDYGYYSPINRLKKSKLSIAASRIRDVVPHWRKGLYALYQCP